MNNNSEKIGMIVCIAMFIVCLVLLALIVTGVIPTSSDADGGVILIPMRNGQMIPIFY